MSTLQLALAALLLTTPAEKLVIKDPLAMHAFVASAVKSLALQWELLDAREVEYLRNAEDFTSDLKLLQDRYGEFHHAPMIVEVERFPRGELIDDMLRFNTSYRESISKRFDLDMVHSEELRIILEETDHLYKVYDALREARTSHLDVTPRRQALARLRELIGQEAFYTGQLPPHVPLWRIPEER